ncbi:hypothetical protein [Desulfobotulus mexicanus]|uniref:Uncharacterized protein n=1 Tax=Desulfobotulus mexicanus TaxID=2586642 RepID=A0A5Q4VGH3_9BACT|nr:hypothetical protein [Desulfobotulus mexicanus]TYT75457.1 hypothetical protein FIM25_05100 [Desulfobotulus mexicanus]
MPFQVLELLRRFQKKSRAETAKELVIMVGLSYENGILFRIMMEINFLCRFFLPESKKRGKRGRLMNATRDALKTELMQALGGS